MNIAIVVQRYGLEVNGGAELHARWIAEYLSQDHDVTVLTTCAKDYQYWKNHYSAGSTRVNSVRVIRFKVKRQRRGRKFITIQNRVFFEPHSIEEERTWIHENGPYTPALIKYIRSNQDDYDFFIFFSFRYYTSFEGLLAVPGKALLVPTAEEDPAIHLDILKDFFNRPAGFIYNSVEEREMINNVANNEKVPGDVVGVGINVLPGEENRFRQKYDITKPYLLYVGRIDKNKGCDRLIDYYIRYCEQEQCDTDLVLMGGKYMNVPKHPGIIETGFVSEEDKFDGIAGCRFMVVPSHLESLCMALLECWALKKSALVNGRCNVLKGQVKRANGGLYYHNYSEFRETMNRLLGDQTFQDITGEQGFRYFQQHYSWPVVIGKYEKMFEHLKKRLPA